MAKIKRIHLPKLGMRIIKTAICVFFCLMLNYLFSPTVALISSLAAIMCMQSTLQSSLKTGLSRVLGTAIGGGIALLLVPLAQNTAVEWLYIILMPAGVALIIYLCVLLNYADGAAMCAFTYIAVLIIPFTDSGSNPFMAALTRILDTLVGVAIALIVNRYVTPPSIPPVTSLHVEVNTFRNIYKKASGKIVGNEQLILIASLLYDSQAPDTSKAPDCGSLVHEMKDRGLWVPVPNEYKELSEIECIYVGKNYKSHKFALTQHSGYIEIPHETYPAALIWHTDETKQGMATYGLLRLAKQRTGGLKKLLPIRIPAKPFHHRNKKRSGPI